jgi:hypothetical protein
MKIEVGDWVVCVADDDSWVTEGAYGEVEEIEHQSLNARWFNNKNPEVVNQKNRYLPLLWIKQKKCRVITKEVADIMKGTIK